MPAWSQTRVFIRSARLARKTGTRLWAASSRPNSRPFCRARLLAALSGRSAHAGAWQWIMSGAARRSARPSACQVAPHDQAGMVLHQVHGRRSPGGGRLLVRPRVGIKPQVAAAGLSEMARASRDDGKLTDMRQGHPVRTGARSARAIDREPSHHADVHQGVRDHRSSDTEYMAASRPVAEYHKPRATGHPYTVPAAMAAQARRP